MTPPGSSEACLPMLLNEPGSALYAERWAPPIAAGTEENYVGAEQLGGLAGYRPRLIGDLGKE